MSRDYIVPDGVQTMERDRHWLCICLDPPDKCFPVHELLVVQSGRQMDKPAAKSGAVTQRTEFVAKTATELSRGEKVADRVRPDFKNCVSPPASNSGG